MLASHLLYKCLAYQRLLLQRNMNVAFRCKRQNCGNHRALR
jgi:hypothetical protein